MIVYSPCSYLFLLTKMGPAVRPADIARCTDGEKEPMLLLRDAPDNHKQADSEDRRTRMPVCWKGSVADNDKPPTNATSADMNFIVFQYLSLFGSHSCLIGEKEKRE